RDQVRKRVCNMKISVNCHPATTKARKRNLLKRPLREGLRRPPTPGRPSKFLSNRRLASQQKMQYAFHLATTAALSRPPYRKSETVARCHPPCSSRDLPLGPSHR